MEPIVEPSDVVSFWFGPRDAEGLAQEAHTQRWFRKDAAFDAEIRARFEPTYHAIMAGEKEGWLAQAEARLAYVLVLDQFSRNMFRGEGRSFAGDSKALQAARAGIECGHDRELTWQQRLFLYMPFMHSEELSDQDRLIELLSNVRENGARAQDAIRGTLDYAQRHRDIIARFGRFPHRNELLGRVSTEEEVAFLKTPGSSF